MIEAPEVSQDGGEGSRAARSSPTYESLARSDVGEGGSANGAGLVSAAGVEDALHDHWGQVLMTLANEVKFTSDLLLRLCFRAQVDQESSKVRSGDEGVEGQALPINWAQALILPQ